jgi:hypothetical protein
MKHLEPGSSNSSDDSGTMVQFVQPGQSCSTDVAFVNPAEFCEPNPELVTSCYTQKTHNDPSRFDEPTIVTVNRNDSGISTPKTKIAEYGDTGAIFGISHQPSTGNMFLASYYKIMSDYGPSGPGAIYQLDTASGTVTTLVNLPA